MPVHAAARNNARARPSSDEPVGLAVVNDIHHSIIIAQLIDMVLDGT
ncbi:hypothetical protein [Mesorhizobium sp. M0590]